MKTRKNILTLILIFGISYIYAQQTASFSEYNFNPFIINAAYAGMTPEAEIVLSHYGNMKINGIEGSPKRYAFSAQAPLQEGRMGIGGGVFRDEIGVTKSTRAFVAYSYKIFLDERYQKPYWQRYEQNVLSFGITAGVHRFEDNLLELGIINDPEFSENIHVNKLEIGVAFLYNYERFYAGVSAPNIVSRLTTENDINLSNPVYGYLGYHFLVNQFAETMLEPNVLFKYEKGAPMQIDMNLAVRFNNKFEVGAGYRSTSSLNFMIGIYLFQNFRFTYQHTLGTGGSPLGNNHGIALAYMFGEGYGSK